MEDVTKVFFNCIREEKWLNEMAQSGMLLCDRTFCTYRFTQAEPNAQNVITVVKFPDAVNNGDSDGSIAELEKQGYTYICGYKCWAYFRGETPAPVPRRSCFIHYLDISLLLLAIYCVAAGVLAYNIDFTLWQLTRGEQPVTTAAIWIFAFILLVLLIPLVQYIYMTVMFFAYRKKGS